MTTENHDDLCCCDECSDRHDFELAYGPVTDEEYEALR